MALDILNALSTIITLLAVLVVLGHLLLLVVSSKYRLRRRIIRIGKKQFALEVMEKHHDNKNFKDTFEAKVKEMKRSNKEAREAQAIANSKDKANKVRVSFKNKFRATALYKVLRNIRGKRLVEAQIIRKIR